MAAPVVVKRTGQQVAWPGGLVSCWVQIPALPLSGCVTSGKLFHLSEPLFLIYNVGMVIPSTQ